jgi:VWFA-related protein
LNPAQAAGYDLPPIGATKMRPLAQLKVCVAASATGATLIGLVFGIALAQSQPPIFRSGINIVEVEVTVLDTKGLPVTDLTSREFQVFEDDARQTIESFSTRTAPVASNRIGGATTATTGASASESWAGSNFVLLLDSGMPERVRFVASEFIDSGVRSGDRVAVIDTRALGGVPPTLSFTTDRGEMIAGVNRIADTWAKRSTATMSSDLASFRAVRDVAARLSASPAGGNTIVFIGAGTGLLWNQKPELIEVARETRRMFEGAMRIATIANIPIHTVEPSGLTPAIPGEALIGETSSFIVDPIERLKARQRPGREDQQSSLRLMAEITGGLDIVNTNNLRANYVRATQQRRPNYVLTYSSPANQRDGKFHSIRVSVNRPGLTLRSKQGYYAFREGGSVTPAVSLPRNLSRDARAALEDEIVRTGIDISVSAAVFTGGRPGTSVLVGVDVDLATRQVSRTVPLELAWAALDEDGAIRAADRIVVDLHSITRDEPISLFRRLALVPGKYRITATATQENGAVGSASVWVDGSELLKPTLLFSDIVLASSKLEFRNVVMPDDVMKRVLPSMPTQRRKFDRAETLMLFAELDDRVQAANRGFTIRSRVTSSAGHVFWKDERDVKAKATRGIKVEYKAQIPLWAMEPGEYALTIDAVDTAGTTFSSAKSLTFTVK